MKKFKLEINVEIEECSDRGDDVVGTIYYPDEGNKIILVKNQTRMEIKETIYHEIGHLIDFYISNGKQSESTEEREDIANNIGSFLEKQIRTCTCYDDTLSDEVKHKINRRCRICGGMIKVEQKQIQ